jgi:hypothetical protein
VSVWLDECIPELLTRNNCLLLNEILSLLHQILLEFLSQLNALEDATHLFRAPGQHRNCQPELRGPTRSRKYLGNLRILTILSNLSTILLVVRLAMLVLGVGSRFGQHCPYTIHHVGTRNTGLSVQLHRKGIHKDVW